MWSWSSYLFIYKNGHISESFLIGWLSRLKGLLHLFFFFLNLFRATSMTYGGSQTMGSIGAVAAGLCQSCVCNLPTAHGNARFLTHWVRPGIEPATLWFLVGFVFPVPWWELLKELLHLECIKEWRHIECAKQNLCYIYPHIASHCVCFVRR